ncbi:MAG: hypothetical protein P1P64_09265 [Treponemataceae bacterium]
MKLRFKLFLSFIVLNFSLYAQVNLPVLQEPEFNFPKLTATGGAHTTQKAEFHTLFTNPALFSNLQKKWNVALLSFEKAVYKSDNERAININAIGPLGFGLTDKNFAFGIFNTTRLKGSASKETVKFNLVFGEELFLTGGYGAEVFRDELNAVSLGIQMKGYFQGFTVVDNHPITASTATKFEPKDFLSDSDPIMFTGAIGFDVGFFYDHNDFFKLGFTVRDLYTATFSTLYANFADFKSSKPVDKSKYRSPIPEINIGIAITPILPGSFTTFTNYTFWLDFNDMLSPIKNERPIYYNLSSGMDFEFNDAYHLRLGFNELAPSFGIGVDAGYFELNYAFWLSQYSEKAWKKIRASFALDLSIKI